MLCPCTIKGQIASKMSISSLKKQRLNYYEIF